MATSCVRGRRFDGEPTFFRALCGEASVTRGSGYRSPGRALARHLPKYAPDGFTATEWRAELARLKTLAEDEDYRGLGRWFSRTFPRCMALVPRHHRGTFLCGAAEKICEPTWPEMRSYEEGDEWMRTRFSRSP